jgi:hypothetical protein
MTKDVRSGALSIKTTPFSATDQTKPSLTSPSKCLLPCQIGPVLGLGLRGPTKIGPALGLGLWGPKPIGPPLGLGLWGPKQIGLFLGPGLWGPKQIGLFLGLGLPGPRPDRTRKSAPLTSDSAR